MGNLHANIRKNDKSEHFEVYSIYPRNYQCSLEITQCKKVTNKGKISPSENCRKLEELDVWHCPKSTDIRIEKLFVENPDDPPISQEEFEQQRLDYVGIVKIGENCPDTEESDLENCKAVTDVGIMAIDDGCTNSKNLKIIRCKKVTNKGMISLSDNCRKLEELDY